MEWSRKFQTIEYFDEAMITLTDNKYLNSRINQLFSDAVSVQNRCVREYIFIFLGYNCSGYRFVANRQENCCHRKIEMEMEN